MKITQKFLLFGLVPVIAQVGICLQMFSLLRTVEFYAEQEAKQSLIDRKLVETISQSLELAVAAGTYANFQVEGTAEFLRLASVRMDKSMSELLELAKDNPQTLADIKELAAFGTATRDQYLSTKKSESMQSDSVKSAPALTFVNQNAFKTGQTFIWRTRRFTKILAKQDALLQQVREKSNGKRNEVKTLIFAELAFCVGLLIVSYVLFRFDFGRRFNDLLQIARDLALDKPVSKTISGEDELVELSEALNDAAQTRREATAQKQMLFQMVTHDLRSPLMAASVVVDTLLRDASGIDDPRTKRLQNVEKSLQRVVGLTNDLLTVEKLAAGAIELHRVKASLKETVDQAMDTVQPLAEKSQCQIINRCEDTVVLIDEDRVLQVLINLLANAIKFSPANTKIEVVSTIKNQYLRVEVLDRGSGISAEEIERLFSPFRQGNSGNAAAGFGLGLAIAKLLVDLHGGEIGAQVRPGGGSIFWFTLAI